MSNKNKKENLKFKIEEFTEADLFEEGLTEKQKEKTKKRMGKMLDELKEANEKLDIDITLEEMIAIKQNLGELGNEHEHGIQNVNVLKYIVLKAIDKNMKKIDVEIIDELFIPNFISLPGVNTSHVYHGSTFFYKFYLTKDKLIYYGISERYEVLRKRSIDLKDIKVIGKSVKNNNKSKGLAWGIDTMTGYTSFIEFNNKEVIYLNHLKRKYRKSAERFITNLENTTGIKAVDKASLTTEDKFVVASQIILVIVFILFAIPTLIKLCLNM